MSDIGTKAQEMFDALIRRASRMSIAERLERSGHRIEAAKAYALANADYDNAVRALEQLKSA